MARGDVRIAVTLACEDCKHRNYQTNKSKRNNPDRIGLRKYCRWCRSTPATGRLASAGAQPWLVTANAQSSAATAGHAGRARGHPRSG